VGSLVIGFFAAAMIVGAALLALGFALGRRDRERDRLMADFYTQPTMQVRSAGHPCSCWSTVGGAPRASSAAHLHALWCRVRGGDGEAKSLSETLREQLLARSVKPGEYADLEEAEHGGGRASP
jgi:hypothetical protein